ncbi:MAG TPA: hypothetical protein VEU76_06070 [Candidatus Udaeobacter sp.]|nr:hypothetical protein [Candidatus Udaeobacter sp.]
MKLSWKDVGSTILVVLGLTLALSVAQGWNWPLLGGVREGIIALAIFGFGAHLLGEPRERSYYSDPFGLITMGIAVAAMAIAIVGGLISGSFQYLVALMIVVPMLWALATLRHAVEGRSAAHRGTLA